MAAVGCARSKANKETEVSANASTANSTESSVANATSNHSSDMIGNSSPTNPRKTVLFDGKNYIKKSGWKGPPKEGTYLEQSEGVRIFVHKTLTGKEVQTKRFHYIYRSPWFYSQDFYYDGADLNVIKGRLEANYFLQFAANEKVFMYSIFGKKVVPPPSSNNEPHEDPFGYRIMDTDGDGVFETFLGDYEELIVPNWVLR